MKLSIVIVNYNVRYFLEQTLVAVYKSIVDFDYEVFVVDNNSSDKSLTMLSQKFPQVIVIANQENVGFSKANNQAIKQSTGEYILLLNPDTIIQEDTLQKCISKMDSDVNIGGLGIKMYDGTGNFLAESKRGFPSPMAAFAKMTGLSKIFPNSKLFGQYHLTYLNKNTTQEIDVLSGAFMLLRKSVLDKIGLLDEDYFMYGEDIDLSYRIKQACYKNIYFADSSIIHFKGESTKKGSLNYIKVFYKAMLIFSQKHITGTQGKILQFLLKIAIYLRAFIAIVEKFFSNLFFPLFDIFIMASNLYVLHLVWENFIKKSDHVLFPDTFFYINIPIYIVIWSFAMWLLGVYTKNTNWRQLLFGLLFGTFCIAIVYAFFPNFLRTSRGIIVAGLVLNVIILSAYRFLYYWQHGNLNTYIKNKKKFIIISNEAEANNIAKQLSIQNNNSLYIGFISLKNDIKNDKHIGTIDNLTEIIELYKPSEILFSTEDLSTQFIIETMVKIKVPITFRLVTKNNTIISSSSKNTIGEVYSFDINLTQKNSWLNKLREWI